MAEFLSYEDASRLFGIPRATLQTKVFRKEIPHIRLGPRTVRFDRAELLAWANARRVAVSR